MSDDKGNTITICMGSSCYSRGNGKNIELIQQFLSEKGLDAKVELVGHLCENQCKIGPNIAINGRVFQQVDSGSVVSLLEHHLTPKQGS